MKKNLILISGIFLIMFNSLLAQAEEKNYYLELVSEWNNIFPDQNRNAAGPKFFKHIISKDITYKDFVEFNKLYCAVSGSLIEPNAEPEKVYLKEVETKKKFVEIIIDVAYPAHVT